MTRANGVMMKGMPASYPNGVGTCGNGVHAGQPQAKKRNLGKEKLDVWMSPYPVLELTPSLTRIKLVSIEKIPDPLSAFRSTLDLPLKLLYFFCISSD